MTTTVVLLYSGCTIAEVIEVATRLKGAELDVQFVSVYGGDVIDESGLIMVPDKAIDEIDRSKVDAVIVPGGDPEAIIGNQAIQKLVSTVAGNGGVVAGICAGVLVLGDAGVLAGRHITHNYRSPWAPPEVAEFVRNLLEGADVEPPVGDVVCVDTSSGSNGVVITALPNATIEFTTAVGQALGLFNADVAELLERHLAGEFVPELFDAHEPDAQS